MNLSINPTINLTHPITASVPCLSSIPPTRRSYQLYGGSLPDGMSGINNLCLPSGGCSVIMMESVGTEPTEVG